MKNKITYNKITSFSNLTFYPMQVPNTGCIAQGQLASGCNITATGGNTGQMADGFNTFLVEVTDTRRKDDHKIVTKRNMSRDDLAFLIEHHRKNAARRNNRYERRRY